MMNLGVAWIGRLPVPDGSDMDTDDERQFMLGAYSGIGWGVGGGGGIGPQTPAYLVGGFAFDTDGRMLTMFLSESEPVPADAQFRSGIAYDMASGARFICPWPLSGVVHRPAGFGGGAAVRSDGAVTFTTGAAERSDGVLAYSERGELCITDDVPTYFTQGYGFVGEKLSITELD